ncbi:MAG: cytochrome C [Acidobacteria bacterium]|nr:MAG: cytochrome C [Acidobacteriota bacterium]
MKAIVSVVVVCLFLLVVTSLLAAPPTPAAKIDRGKYLVEHVGMCGDCHTPHNEKGEPIREKWLQGSPLAFKPTVPMPVWADKTPNIAGLAGWQDKDAVKFLMTGIAYNDLPGRPPMPQYRFNQEDASAIVAYLRSLTPGSASQAKQ